MAEEIRVEVVIALAQRQQLVSVTLQQGACVADAIAASGLIKQFDNVDFEKCPVGIWGRVAGRDSPVHDGDRVEVYRALTRDPREARRELARLQKLGSSS